MADIQFGYLDTPENAYLEGPYLAGEGQDGIGMQINMVINDNVTEGMQTEMIVNSQSAIGMQVAQFVNDFLLELGMQVNAESAATKIIGMQIEQFLASTKTLGMSVKADTLRHALLGTYLVDEYLVGSYLVDQMAAYLGMQVYMAVGNTDEIGMQVNSHIETSENRGMQALAIINAEDAEGMQIQLVVDTSTSYGMQIQQIINDQRNYGMQVEMIVNTSRPYGMQIKTVNVVKFGMQSTMVIYNNTQLRLMYIFPSRGTAALLGLNWTASSTYPGDFLVRNLNTDIIEQVYRSADSTASLVELVCDTGLPQGVPVDTIAILGHNLTTSATVQVQGSQDNFATPPSITFNMFVESQNMYWISPALPNSAGQNRYWKFIIQDPTNPDGYVQIGTILFGDSHIFTVKETFIQPITRGYKHFKDELPNEGFTVKSNDRALKKWIRLGFEKLDYSRGNFQLIDDMLQYVRTSLKVLVIPTPEYPSRFAVFGKVVDMPELSHIDNGVDTDYVDFSLEFNEAN